jgi:predicted RNA-binding Zn-ribbon protein involved in translation (DUF1610 family)
MNSANEATRTNLRDWLTRQLGKPYLWNAKGEVHIIGGQVSTECYDCSGLVTSGLMAVGYPTRCPHCGLTMKGWHNCRRLFFELRMTEKPQPLDLAFYGPDPDSVEHVMFVWGDGRVMGACGGNKHSTDPMQSLRSGQKVQFRHSPNYRPGLLGYRELPAIPKKEENNHHA